MPHVDADKSRWDRLYQQLVREARAGDANPPRRKVGDRTGRGAPATCALTRC